MVSIDLVYACFASRPLAQLVRASYEKTNHTTKSSIILIVHDTINIEVEVVKSNSPGCYNHLLVDASIHE